VLANVFRQAGGEIYFWFEPLAVLEHFDSNGTRGIEPACVLAVFAAEEEAGVFAPLRAGLVPRRPNPARLIASPADMRLDERTSLDHHERLVLGIGAVFQSGDDDVVRGFVILVPADPYAIARRISRNTWIPAVAAFVAADLDRGMPAVIVITAGEDAR